MQLGQLLLTMDGAVVLISRTSPIPTMRLPARKKDKKNVWVESLPSPASQEEIKLKYYPKIEVQVVEQTKR